ncbi:MAG: trigger factor [Anaerolineae bacterium]
MQIEHLDNHTAQLTIEVNPERLDRAMQMAARKISQKITIPGFRKGKAPLTVVANYVGQQAVLEEALEELGNEVYREALKESGIEPYTMGTLEDFKIEPAPTLVFNVPKAPEVKLNAYREVRVDYTAPVITDDMVKNAIEALRERRAVLETVERPAQLEDVITVKIFGEVIHPDHEHDHAHDSEEKPEGETEHTHEHHTHAPETFINEESMEILLSTDEKRDFMPGFSEKVVGVTVGEERKFSLTFPDDYDQPQYAGHTFNVTLTVQEVKSRLLPELNDEFAAGLGEADVTTLEELTARVRRDLEASALRENDDRYSDQVFEKIVEGAEVKYPEAMVEEYIDDVLKEIDQNLRQQGLSLAQLKTARQQDDEAFRASYREVAIGRLKRSLVLRGLVASEQLAVKPEELEAQIDSMARRFSADPNQTQTFRRMLERDRDRIGVDMVMSRLKSRLAAIGRGEAPSLEVLSMPTAESQISLPSSTSEAAPKAAQSESSESSVESASESPDGDTSTSQPTSQN